MAGRKPRSGESMPDSTGEADVASDSLPSGEAIAQPTTLPAPPEEVPQQPVIEPEQTYFVQEFSRIRILGVLGHAFEAEERVTRQLAQESPRRLTMGEWDSIYDEWKNRVRG